MSKKINISPFDHCLSLEGYHCQTNSLAKIYYYHGHSISEEMLLGLGAGMGFIYWKMKMGTDTYVFIGGRGNNKHFFNDVGNRTGVKIETISTTSAKKAESALLEKMNLKEPVMLFGDMGFLPWFDLPQDYHFGGHTFVICGYNGEGSVLASDIDNKASGLKKGFYYPITLEQLSKARSSTYKPFPPKNTYLEFDFSQYHKPNADDIYSAIKQTVTAQIDPPIKNLGVKGLRYASKEILNWPDLFSEYELRMNLFSIYIFIEIGGTGGGCFRYMYSRFLRESAKIIQNNCLHNSADKIQTAGDLFSEIGLLFKDAEETKDLENRIKKASNIFMYIAELEEDSYIELSRMIQS